MKTDQLLTTLAADTLPRAPVSARVTRALPVALALSLTALVLFWGVRDDVAGALASVAVTKTLLPLVVAGFALALALALARPDARPQVAARAVLLLGALTLALFAGALIGQGVTALGSALFVPSLIVCFASVPLLALPILAALLWALSSGATLNPGRAGGVAGLAAGGLSAGLYSLFCDQDALLFFLPAYGVAIALVAGLGFLAGPRALRW